jgi:RHS repeat-associated protein
MIYDSAGNLLSETTGQSTTAAYAHPSTTSFGYDALNRQFEVIQGFGSSAVSITTTVYDKAGNVLSTSDPDGHVTSYAYDSLNRQVEQIAGFGTAAASTTTMLYDAAGNLLSQTTGQSTTPAYAHPSTTSYAYDALNRQVEQIDGYGTAAASTTTMLYDAAGNLLSKTSGQSTTAGYANASTTSYAYDALNRQVEQIDGYGTAVATTTTMLYDAAGNLLSETTGESTSLAYAQLSTTSYAYDAQNRQIEKIDGYGSSVASTTTMLYDPAGNLLSETTGQSVTTGYANASTTSYAYDALNRQVEKVDGYGTAIASTTTMLYDAAGNLLSETTGQSTSTGYAHLDTTSFAYDAQNRQTLEVDAYGTSIQETTTTVYDAAGNVVKTVNARGNPTTYSYDALDRQVTEQTPAGGTMTTVYDAAGNILAQIDQLGHATSYSYDALDRRVTQTDADGHTTTYAYDAAGNQVTLTDADHNTTTMIYDALNRMVQEINPLGNSSTFAYDAANLLATSTDADGHVIVYNYDALDRKTGATWLSFDITVNVQTFTYDAAGNQLTAANQNGAYTMAYDALNRETSVQEPFGQALTYTYDAAGNQIVVQDSQGGTTTNAYDALNRLTTKEFGGPGQTTLREDLTYTADNQIATETRNDNLAGTVPVGTSSYTYDAADRLTSLVQTYANGSVLASYVYNYDQASRLSSEVDNGGATIVYSYDNANQLLSAGSTTYSYDATGNRTNYTTGTDNQLIFDGTNTYTYDAQGNLLSKTAGNDITTYSYDTENRLVGAIETVGGTLQTQATYVYDVIGNRIETEEYTAAGGQVTTEYAYDGANAWANLSSPGALENRQLFLPGQDQMLARVSGVGTAAWYLTDRQGSVRNLISYDGSMGLDTIGYDAYGNVTSESTPAQGDAYKYDGYVYDALVGLYYVRARYYNASTGRWIQQDPISFQGGDANLYRYVRNSPTLAVDTTGKTLTISSMADGPTVGPDEGQFSWNIQWNPSESSAQGGVIIQHVERLVYAFNNAGDRIDTKALNTIDYYEAWGVEGTDVTPVTVGEFNDTFSFDGYKAGQDTSGYSAEIGVAWYFPSLTEADLKKNFGFTLGGAKSQGSGKFVLGLPTAGHVATLKALFAANKVAADDIVPHIAVTTWGWCEKKGKPGMPTLAELASMKANEIHARQDFNNGTYLKIAYNRNQGPNGIGQGSSVWSLMSNQDIQDNLAQLKSPIGPLPTIG